MKEKPTKTRDVDRENETIVKRWTQMPPPQNGLRLPTPQDIVNRARELGRQAAAQDAAEVKESSTTRG